MADSSSQNNQQELPKEGSRQSSEGTQRKKDNKDLPYVTSFGETLGTIAKKFRLPSWKYLYQLNKKVIGDNPDLLKPGTELKIPTWDTTKGDELIREKGANPSAYLGGLQYRYPMVPISITLTDTRGKTLKDRDENGKELEEFKEAKEYVVIDAESGKELAKGTLKKADELELLIPDVKKWYVKIDGVIYR